jgi:hypothetical protein
MARRQVAQFAAAVFILAASVSARPPIPKPGEPRLFLSPRSGMAPIGRSLLVRLRVEIARPTPDFFCPSVEITIYGTPGCTAEQSATARDACDSTDEGVPTFHSKAESDCEPWRETEEIVVEPDGGHFTPPTRDVPWSWPYIGSKLLGLGTGEWTIEVRVEQGAKHYTLRDRVIVS